MKKIFITVDTECHNITQVNKYIWGKVGKESYGINCILEQAKRHQIPINFFFDMCESNRYGDDYSKRIIEEIQSYGQPIYLHLHPNYISGDDTRSFLWQYSKEEQKEILRYGFDQYYSMLNTDKCLAFRVGRYGASPDMYESMDELGIRTIDLSYCHNNYKMCHLTENEVKTVNAPTYYNNQIILPNTRFVCFDFLGRKKSINTDLHEASFREIKEVLNKAKVEDIVFTMHSWHFIDKRFYRKSIRGDKKQIKKFEKIITYCKRHNYEFADIGKVDFDSRIEKMQEVDSELNLCRGLWGKLKSLYTNFFRFQEIAKLNKKYFAVYLLFYTFLSLGLIGLILLILL